MLATTLIVTLLVLLALCYTAGRDRRCRHDFVFVCGIYGDRINYTNGKRSVWQCACGKWEHREELINPPGSSAPYFWPGVFEQQEKQLAVAAVRAVCLQQLARAAAEEEMRRLRERVETLNKYEPWGLPDHMRNHMREMANARLGRSQSLGQSAAARWRALPRSDGQRRCLSRFLPDRFPRL